MNFWQSDFDWAMPGNSPAYPRPGGYYQNVIFQLVYFTTDIKNIAPLLPEPLEPSPTGRCCAFGINAQFCADYGPFQEAGVAVGCLYEGKEAFFLPCLFLNSADPIAPGREIWGSPKKFANIKMIREGNEITTTAIRADVPIMQINSRLTEVANEDEVPALWPLYMLKVIPAADGNGLTVKQLIEGAPPEDVEVLKLFKGPGVVSFRPTVAGEFWRLTPNEFEGAVFQECNYHQGFGKIIKDYLK